MLREEEGELWEVKSEVVELVHRELILLRAGWLRVEGG